jgi:hypothetical protein
MSVEHFRGDRACCNNDADLHCAGRTVERLSDERVLALAEEIWTASTGSLMPVGRDSDPRGCRPGASAQAAYRRHRQLELEAWRPGWHWRAGLATTAAVCGVVVIGLAAGAELAWRMVLPVALLTWWRLRFRPSAGTRVWRRQAVAQGRTAGLLQPLDQHGYLVLHDSTLAGWPAGLDHLVVGPTGIWVIRSWHRGRLRWQRKGTWPSYKHGPPAGALGGLRRQATAIAEALGSDISIPVRPLLCVHGGGWPGSRRPIEGVMVATPRHLEHLLRRPRPHEARDVERATARLLEVLRPAA